ncbi:MAG: PrsW family intramembrane metalloprotease [Thermoplasmata archaeon]|nr:MAG: PrsW family intramembrane metalloprotease [Thermoplasmata archaeon]
MYPQSPYPVSSQFGGTYAPYVSPKRPIVIPFLSNGFLFVQSITILLSVLAGMTLFFYNFSFWQVMLIWIIIGTVNILNLPFLIGSWEKLDEHYETELQYVVSLLDKIKKEHMYRSQNRGGWDSYYGDIAGIQFQISPLLNRQRIPKEMKYIITLLFITPIWPVAFYLIHHKMMAELRKHDHVLNEVYRELESAGRNLGLEIITPYMAHGTVTKNRELYLYGFIAAFCIIGYLLVFYHPSSGFFGLFWSYMLIRDVNDHSQRHLDKIEVYREYDLHVSVQNSISTKEIGNLSNLDIQSRTQILQPYRSTGYSPMLLYIVFVTGATSGFIAMFTNTIYMLLGFPIGLFSVNLFLLFVVTIIAPVVEESSKIFALWILKTEEETRFRTIHWVLMGVVAGLGFAILEDYAYFQSFWIQYSPHGSYLILLMRLSFPVHLLASATAGFGVAEWKRTDNPRLFIFWLIVAMFIHGTYNLLVTIGVSQ